MRMTNKQIRFFATIPLLLLPLLGTAEEERGWSVVATKVQAVASVALKDFQSVSVTKEVSLLVVEADASVRDEPLYNAAGRQSGTHRVAESKEHGFILRVEYRKTANNIRRTFEVDRGGYTLYETKVILLQEKDEESTDVRATAVFIRFECGKKLDDAWRRRLQEFIRETQSFDVKNKKE